MRQLLPVFALLILVPLLGQCSHEPEMNFDEPWRTRLYAPTMMTHLDGFWFIVDAWHHRILYIEEFSTDLTDWEILTENAAGPHSIASDGDILIFDDTGRGVLQAAQLVDLNEETFVTLTNTTEYLGERPHRVVYDYSTDRFYTINSNSQEIVRLRSDNGLLVVENSAPIPILGTAYSRSLTIFRDRMYVVSRGGMVTEMTYRHGLYETIRVYDMPPKFENMIDAYLSDSGWIYVSAKPYGFGRARSFEDFENGNYEDLYQKIGFKGIPYYITEIEGRLVVPFLDHSNGILSFDEDEDGNVIDVRTIFDFGPASVADFIRKQMNPV